RGARRGAGEGAVGGWKRGRACSVFGPSTPSTVPSNRWCVLRPTWSAAMLGLPAPEAPPAKEAARSPSTARVAHHALMEPSIGAIFGPPIPQKGESDRGIESPLRGTPRERTRVIVRFRRFSTTGGQFCGTTDIFG